MRGAVQIDNHTLELCIAFDDFRAHIDPNSARPMSLVRNGTDPIIVAVDPDKAAVHPRGQTVRPAEVVGPNSRSQAITRLVGNAHRVLFVVEVDNREHRPEDLLLSDSLLCIHMIEDRGIDIETAV